METIQVQNEDSPCSSLCYFRSGDLTNFSKTILQKNILQKNSFDVLVTSKFIAKSLKVFCGKMSETYKNQNQISKTGCFSKMPQDCVILLRYFPRTSTNVGSGR